MKDIEGNENSPVYYCSTLITEDNCDEYGDEDSVGHFFVALEDREHWHSRHCLIDYETDAMIAAKETIPDFPYQEAENVYVVPPEIIEAIVRSPLFYAHPEFVEFMG